MEHARFKNAGDEPAPRYWELGVTGWGGVAPRESGVRLQESCPGCGLLTYSSYNNASKLIDASSWDCSDVFMVWPLPRYIFVTDRALHIIRAEEFTGVEPIEVSSLEAKFPHITPGRPAHWLPDDSARRFGEPLGIY